MKAIEQTRLSEIAQFLRTAATWVEGPRRTKLHDVAKELDGGLDNPGAEIAPSTENQPPAAG